jgi:hypothetical protein
MTELDLDPLRPSNGAEKTPSTIRTALARLATGGLLVEYDNPLHVDLHCSFGVVGR